ncbi:hypothetical protein ES703_07086 [subsurface metagenome]
MGTPPEAGSFRERGPAARAYGVRRGETKPLVRFHVDHREPGRVVRVLRGVDQAYLVSVVVEAHNPLVRVGVILKPTRRRDYERP